MWSHPQRLSLWGGGWERERLCFLAGRPPYFCSHLKRIPKGFNHTPWEWLLGLLSSRFEFLRVLFVFQTLWAQTFAHVWLMQNSGRVPIHFFARGSCAVPLSVLRPHGGINTSREISLVWVWLSEQLGTISFQFVLSGRIIGWVGIANRACSGQSDTCLWTVN